MIQTIDYSANEHETQLDEILCDQFSVDENLDKYLEEQNLLGWIELIENEDLHKAIKNLSLEEQILLSYIFYNDINVIFLLL